jgi:hypothetical protein
MTDNKHNTSSFLEHINRHALRVDQPWAIYWGMSMIPLYLFGHHDKVVQVGTEIVETIGNLWSLRVSYLVYFYLSLAILTRHLDNPTHNDLDSRLDDVLKYKAEIDYARSCCEANYAMWSLILEALLCEIREQFPAAVQAYEVGDLW